jgi:hypothetical protein
LRDYVSYQDFAAYKPALRIRFVNLSTLGTLCTCFELHWCSFSVSKANLKRRRIHTHGHDGEGTPAEEGFDY